MGQVADLFLVFAQWDGKPSAFLVERQTPGLTIQPMAGLLGLRGLMLAELQLQDCRIAAENLVGAAGFGIDAVAAMALNLGRYSIAWGAVGMAQACMEACLQYSVRRRQFGTYLKDHQLIRKMISDMLVEINAGRLLCHDAGRLQARRDPAAVAHIMMAKYYTTRMAHRVVNDAVQVHGALGLSDALVLERNLRDAKVMEIIEGTTQMLQLSIAEYGFQEYGQS